MSTALKATVVMSLSLAVLWIPPLEGSAATHSNGDLCNQWVPFEQCGDEEAEDIACNGICPDWVWLQCDEEGGLYCSDTPV